MDSTLEVGKQRKVAEQKYALMTFVFFLGGLFVISTLYVTIPLHTVFMAQFNLSAEQAALITSVCSFCYAIGTLVFAPLSDRFGRKKIIIVGLILLAIVTPIIGILHNFETVVMFRGLQGFIAASFAPTALTFLNDLYPLKKRAVAIGFISGSFLMAGIFGQVYSSVLIVYIDWSYVFYVFGFIYLGIMIAFIFAIPNDTNKHNVEISTLIGSFITVLTKPFFMVCFLITTLLLLSFVGTYTALEGYLKDDYRLGETHILVVRSAGILGMLIAPFGGRLAGQYGSFKMIRFGLALSALGLFLLGFSTNLIILGLMSIVFTAGISLTVPSLISLIGQYGQKETAAAMSLYSFFLFVGSTIGPILSVFIMTRASYMWSFISIAILLTIGFLITFYLVRIKS